MASLVISPKSEVLRSKTVTAGEAGVLQLHGEAARTSPLASWYVNAAGLRSKGKVVIIHEMRLGYPCAWQITDMSGDDTDCCALNCTTALLSLQECERGPSSERDRRPPPPGRQDGWVFRLHCAAAAPARWASKRCYDAWQLAGGR